MKHSVHSDGERELFLMVLEQSIQDAIGNCTDMSNSPGLRKDAMAEGRRF